MGEARRKKAQHYQQALKGRDTSLIRGFVSKGLRTNRRQYDTVGK